MADNSAIEWTDATWNPVVGCTRASAGCDNCYAVTMTKRLAAMGLPQYQGLVNTGKGHFNGTVRTVPAVLLKPFSWKRPKRIFVNSMSDLFHKDVPIEFIDKVFSVMALTPQHTYQVLTKRPKRMAEYMCGYHGRNHIECRDWLESRGFPRKSYVEWPIPNVWLGTSVENDQVRWRIDCLRNTEAAVKFLSLEPLIGPLKNLDLAGIDWVIVGGESGPNARPMRPDWARSIRDQCVQAGVPFFFKQWGGVQKGNHGRLLDGRTWDEFPNGLKDKAT